MAPRCRQRRSRGAERPMSMTRCFLSAIDDKRTGTALSRTGTGSTSWGADSGPFLGDTAHRVEERQRHAGEDAVLDLRVVAEEVLGQPAQGGDVDLGGRLHHRLVALAEGGEVEAQA